jgi:PAS domain S-box-containing protein
MDADSFLTSSPDLLDRLHDAVISTNLEGIVIDCNSAAERAFEYSRRELIGKSVACLYPESELPRMADLIREVTTSGKCDGEFLNKTKSGREIYIHLSVSLLTDRDQKPVGIIGFSIDITEQKKAALAQREIEEMNQAARDATGVGTWYWDLDTNRLRWDEISSRLLGIPAEEEQSFELFLGQIHELDRSRVHRLIRSSISSGSEYAAEYRVIHSDNSERWLSARGQTLRDETGKPLRMLGTATDVTDKKIVEQKLKQAEAKYRVLFESPIIGVVSADLDTITDANDAYCDMIGYSREELLSGQVRWQDITPQEYLARDFAALQDLLSTGVATPFEKEYVRKDGKHVRVIIGAALISREPVSWSCFVLNMTDEHRALSALRLSEQMAAAARMGSALAHEINNPLASLTNIIYLMRFGSSSTRRDELLVSAEDALDRVSRITRQMIGIYSEAGTVSPIRISEVLDDTLAGYSARIRSKGIHLETRNEVGDGVFVGVESDVRRLISSLVENAVEHTPVGGKVKIHLFPSRDRKDDLSAGMKIVVMDNGPGIPKDNFPHLFEPFFSTKKTKATGLGLWTSKNIVEKYKGKLRIRSSTRSGKSGTCVAVFLQDNKASAELVKASR